MNLHLTCVSNHISNVLISTKLNKTFLHLLNNSGEHRQVSFYHEYTLLNCIRSYSNARYPKILITSRNRKLSQLSSRYIDILYLDEDLNCTVSKYPLRKCKTKEGAPYGNVSAAHFFHWSGRSSSDGNQIDQPVLVTSSVTSLVT